MRTRPAGVRVPERHGHAAERRERRRIAAEARLDSAVHGHARPDRVSPPYVNGRHRPAARLLS